MCKMPQRGQNSTNSEKSIEKTIFKTAAVVAVVGLGNCTAAVESDLGACMDPKSHLDMWLVVGMQDIAARTDYNTCSVRIDIMVVEQVGSGRMQVVVHETRSSPLVLLSRD